MNCDYLIVGAGLTGATIARTLHDAGWSVLLLERRASVGGAMHDWFHPSGFRVGTYGHKLVRTSNEKVWRFLNRFCPFFLLDPRPVYEHAGDFLPWPPPKEFLHPTPTLPLPANLEESLLRVLQQPIYERFVKPAIQRDWGLPAEKLSPRLPLYPAFELELFPLPRRYSYCGLPELGFSELVRTMLEDIPTLLNVDYQQMKNQIAVRKLTVYTGFIDEFFSFSEGRLPYVSFAREDSWIADREYVFPGTPVFHSGALSDAPTRSIEWKWCQNSEFPFRGKGTLITTETPKEALAGDAREWPKFTAESRRQYLLYREQARSLSDVIICGAAGEFSPLDAAQSVGSALSISERILASAQMADLSHVIREVEQALQSLHGQKDF